MRVLGFGTSHSVKRQQTGWSDPLPFRSALAIALPDYAIHGDSWGKGADDVFDVEAKAHFAARGLSGRVLPFRVDPDRDGRAKNAPILRNVRMHREGKPDVGIGGIMGKIGTPWSRGSAHMAEVCEKAGTPLVIYREDGIELPTPTDPECRGDRMAGDLWYARRMLRGLVRFAREDVIAAGMAVAAAHDRVAARMPTSAVRPYVAAAWSAVEVLRGRQPRLGPWLDVVEGLVKRHA